jgi:hypothetical protein
MTALAGIARLVLAWAALQLCTALLLISVAALVRKAWLRG